jgi:Putative restriction endonuclease
MVQTPIKSIAIEEFLKLPETKPASEFIDGQIIQKPMPQGKHSTIQRDLVNAIDSIIKQGKIAHDPADKLGQPMISVFEIKEDLLPVPEFAQSFKLTVGQLFDWLEN